MAITRRQFVTRLGALAAAMGMSQADLSKVVEVFAHRTSDVWNTGWADKPKVVWVHGAECTGCSTSLLSLFEDVRGKAIENTSISTLAALDYAVGGSGDGGHVAGTITAGALGGTKETGADHPYGHRTLFETDGIVGAYFEDTPYVATIADVLIDFIDLQYHETVMGMGGDLAYQWLKQLVDDTTGTTAPFVLVVEGAVQPEDKGGYWNELGTTPWCSIGMNEAGTGELEFDHVVAGLANNAACLAVIPIGQCACFGGYPACSSPVLSQDASGLANGGNMTGAMGVYDFLADYGNAGVENKVVNVPGCPTNPWWFILTVVAWLVDFQTAGTNADGALGILHRGATLTNVSVNAASIDSARRLKAVYGIPLHGPYCKRYQSALNGIFATKPGDAGCLQLIGCKGPSVGTLCGPRGWNGQNPRNNAVDSTLDYGVSTVNGTKGGNCVAGGSPCMACTEPGYPDAFLPFVVR